MTRRQAHSEDGFTIVEVLIAALILVAGAIATFGVLASATVNTQRAKATQIALSRAEQEMEALRSLSDEELALTTAPSHSSEESNPSYRVNNGKFALTREPSPSEYKELVVNGGVKYPSETLEGGKVSPGPTSFTSGEVSGKIYRYIVWRNDTSCSSETCPGEQDYKTIVVAVKLNSMGNGGTPGGYVEVQSNFVDPEHSAADNPIPGAEGVVTGQQFFLSDMPCSTTGETSYEEITANHPLHNTLGTCASGLHTGATKGAPDALLTGSPPDPTPEEPNTPLTYDYSSDYEGSPTQETAKGIQLRREESAGCVYKVEGRTNAQWEIHRWVTDPMPKEFVMTSGESIGHVTLDFFTRALSDSLYAGKLCIYLFKREESGTSFTDTMLANREGGASYWTFSPGSNWPKGGWKEEILTMSFNAPVKIPKGARLGLALSLERAGTQGDAVSILYDNPNDRSRIEVATTTPLEGG